MPDVAVAPRLRRQPGDDLGEVALLLLGVLVGGPTAAAARAPQVEPATA